MRDHMWNIFPGIMQFLFMGGFCYVMIGFSIRYQPNIVVIFMIIVSISGAINGLINVFDILFNVLDDYRNAKSKKAKNKFWIKYLKLK